MITPTLLFLVLSRFVAAFHVGKQGGTKHLPIVHFKRSLMHQLGKSRQSSRSDLLRVTSSNELDENNDRYWNREISAKGLFSSGERKIVKEARIISLSDPNDDANSPLHAGKLPEGASLLAVGTCFEDFDIDNLKKMEPNVVFVSYLKGRPELAKLLDALPSLEWVQTRTAGIDFITSKTLEESSVETTNAKGQFSSTLAEYSMMAIAYFAKDLPRLMRQKKEKNWEKYSVEEIRGKSLGVVGYGDIGRACARLAKAYGMKIIAQRRNPELCADDPLCDVVYSKEDLNKLMAESDYVVVALPLTDETLGMVGREAFASAKESTVVINVGRGPIVDEDALTNALESGKIKGAALDVFTIEPLPETSKLWDLENVLISPHNMDQTETFMHESTEFFVNENLPRFISGEELLNPVNIKEGY